MIIRNYRRSLLDCLKRHNTPASLVNYSIPNIRYGLLGQQRQARSYISFPGSSQIQSMLSEYITNAWNQISSSQKNGYDGDGQPKLPPSGNNQEDKKNANNEDDDKCPHVFKLIPLHDSHLISNTNNKSECTLYVKGFLSSHTNRSLTMAAYSKVKNSSDPTEKNEADSLLSDRSHFQFWQQSHKILSHKPSHMWSENAYGWEWPNGRFPHQFNFSSPGQQQEHEKLKQEGKIGTYDEPKFNPLSYVPLPVTTLALAAFQILMLLYRGRSVLKFLNPTLFLTTILQDIAFTVVVGYLEFKQANINATQYAHLLCDEIQKLNKQYERVRVVAHSLGAKHAVEAIKLLRLEERPSEVHLCAAALAEQDYSETFAEGLTNVRDPKHISYSYWSDHDSLLKIIFRTITMGELAVGCNELRGKYDRFYSVHVDTDHFPRIYNQAIVHNMYGPNFHKFARSA